MKLLRLCAFGLALLALSHALSVAEQQPRKTPKEALQAFNDLIGTWRGTGTPSGTKQEQQKGFWVETQNWGWEFKGKDAWIVVAFEKGKHYKSGEMRYLPDNDAFQFTLVPVQGDKEVYVGQIVDKVLTLERTDDKTKASHRLVFNLLHPNRYLYRYEMKAEDKVSFARLYSVGVTKEGEFASGDGKPECIVSGGLGTSTVSYMGQTYYVCCSGCRTEFNADPAKYVREFKEKQAAKKAK